jgi:hypothetical protein
VNEWHLQHLPFLLIGTRGHFFGWTPELEALHKAASEVRYLVIFSTTAALLGVLLTEPNNGASGLGLAPHRATVLTTKHSPAESARKKSGVGVGCSSVSRELLDCRLQLAVAEQDHQLCGAHFFEQNSLNRIQGLSLYGWTGQETGSGLSDRPRAILGQIHF